jgi:leader peptidase (prepilin peptidase)/N-methyltransferase
VGEVSSLLPFWLGALIVFVYGTVIGSFLNVCIYRMPHDESIVKPPSHCPKCNTKLRGLDLVPLLSFLLLGRKCRYCSAKISWRYFGVELLTGILLVLLFAKYHFEVNFFVFGLFATALIAVFFIDLEHWIIPDQLSVFAMVLGIIRDIAGFVMHEEGHVLLRIPIPYTDIHIPMLWSIAGLIVCYAIFYAIAVFGELAFKKEAMGGGDLKLAAGIGAVFCGSITTSSGLGLALLSFFIAIFVGSFIGVGMMLASRGKRRPNKKIEGEEIDGNSLPFGPMMVVGVIITMFFGSWLINTYLSYLNRGF